MDNQIETKVVEEESGEFVPDYPVSNFQGTELTSGNVLKKVIDLEISEEARLKLFKKFQGKSPVKMVQALISVFPTRDFAHGNTTAADEFSILNDYEIAVQLMNLNPKVFHKAALIFMMRAIGKVQLTKSREMAFVKNLQTSWSGLRDPVNEENWRYNLPFVGRGGGR